MGIEKETKDKMQDKVSSKQQPPVEARNEGQAKLDDQALRNLGNSYLQTASSAPSDTTKDTERPIIQPKLWVNRPDDRYERQADQIADDVMKPPIQIQYQWSVLEHNHAQLKPLHFHHKGNTPVEATYAGKPLSISDRIQFENHFGYDLSPVCIHTDSRADKLSKYLVARAFTVGPDIYFRAGQYSPTTFSGRHLLAHEIAHSVQQANKLENNIIPDIQRSEFVSGQGSYSEFDYEYLSERQLEKEIYRTQDLKQSGLEDEEQLERRQEVLYKVLAQKQQKRESLREQRPEVEHLTGISLDRAETHILREFDEIYRDLTKFFMKVVNAEGVWTSFIRDIGTAFANAYKSREDAIKVDIDVKRQQDEITKELLGMILSPICVGLTKFGTGKLTRYAGKNRLVNGVAKLFQNTGGHLSSYPTTASVSGDIAKEFVREVVDLGVEEYLRSQRTEATAELPPEFQNLYLNKVEAALQDLRKDIIDAADLVRKASSEAGAAFRYELSPENVSQYARGVIEIRGEVWSLIDELNKEKLFDTPPKYDPKDLLREILRALWAQWLKQRKVITHEKHVRRNPYSPYRREEFEELDAVFGTEIRKSMTEARIDDAVSLWDLKGLVAWGNSYEPRAIVELD